MKTYVNFKLEKNLSSEFLNKEKTYDFVIKSLKNDPLETYDWRPMWISN